MLYITPPSTAITKTPAMMFATFSSNHISMFISSFALFSHADLDALRQLIRLFVWPYQHVDHKCQNQ